MKKVRILFVCLGNICRSPLGAAILKKKVADEGLQDRVEVDSCGTSDYHIGDNADHRTITNALQHGVPIEHCARQLTRSDIDQFDFIFAMDKSNYQNILRLTHGGNGSGKIKMMREFDPLSKGGEVPDPYHGGQKDFQEVYEILDRSTGNFLEYLKKSFL